MNNTRIPTAPNLPHTHGQSQRYASAPLRSSHRNGLYGRMFRHLAPLDSSDDALLELAKTMSENIPSSGPAEQEKERKQREKSRLFAGVTYFGQFIDHDLTFDAASSIQRDNDPDAIVNFRTPKFDLDSVYGGGPNLTPYLYKRNKTEFEIASDSPEAGESDLPRNASGLAIIADPRNDENTIISQVHLAILKYHNRVVAELKADLPEARSDRLFAMSQQVVRWHYQWAVLTDFLTSIGDPVPLIGPEAINARNRPNGLLTFQPYPCEWVPRSTPREIDQTPGRWKANLSFYRWRNEPFMPVEFSGAAFRFGHSLVRSHYSLNQQQVGLVLFDASARSRQRARDLGGIRRRPKHYAIDWMRFFPANGTTLLGSAPELQLARPLDSLLAEPLAKLPMAISPGAEDLRLLSYRNLLRAKSLGLPCGQDVARAMGLPEELIIDRITFKRAGDERLGAINRIREYQANIWGSATPLWYYILLEAEIFCGGERLGPVGAMLVTEVIVGLLCADSRSFINVSPRWQPEIGRFGCRQTGVFTMLDLLTASELRPHEAGKV